MIPDRKRVDGIAAHDCLNGRLILNPGRQELTSATLVHQNEHYRMTCLCVVHIDRRFHGNGPGVLFLDNQLYAGLFQCAIEGFVKERCQLRSVLLVVCFQ